MNTPIFLTLEGVNGSGKSTAIKPLSSVFEDFGLPYITTREIGGNAFCESIRLLSFDTKLDNRTLALLAFAARVEHVEKVIKPALQKGISVLCDRFDLSTYAYQGVQGGMPLPNILDIEKAVDLKWWKPYYTFILDAPFKVLKQRIQARDRGCRYDGLSEDEVAKMQKFYAAHTTLKSGRFYMFDTSKDDAITNMQDTLRRLIDGD